jgi:GTP cyclohydrolase FolE2
MSKSNNKIVSYIEADKGDNLYLVIDRSDEVEVIMKACMVYLSDKGSNA